MLKRFLNKFLTYYVYRDWNIAIADISEDLDPVNVKWMKHNYRDRWFADPFVISETDDCYIVLVEECMHASGRGRIARLHVTKDTCELVKNETILDLPTHLSFPNFVINQTTTYLYPENASAGNTRYYRYGDVLDCCGIMTDEPLADAVMVEHQNEYYILATKGGDCNGSVLLIYHSLNQWKGYKKVQEVRFDDNIARRAGNVFEHNGCLISPAQVNNVDYGEGLSLQYLNIKRDRISLKEFKRIKPLHGKYSDGLHTYNVFGNRKVVIDGYRYRSHLLHKLYVKFRNPQ